MLKITGQSIMLTKGDDASIQLIPRYKDGTAYTFASGDKGYFRLKVGSTLIEKECDIYADLNKMVISFQPEDTVNLNPGIYRYEVELITIYGFHYTFIADQTFIIGKEYEQRLQSSSGSNGTPGSNLPQVDGELTEDPIVSGEIQPTNPSIDYNNLTNKPKLNGVQIAGEHDNAYYGIPTALSELTDDEGHRTVSDTEKSTWDNKSDFSGSYNDLTDVPSDLVEDENYVHTDNNYTSTEKTKLGTIAEGAEVNVNADWNASSGDAEILNKPTLGTAAAKDYTSSVLENSADLVESGAVKTAIDNAISSVYKPSGNKACAELISGLLIASNLGNVYNMTDDGVTTADFVEGAGKTIEAGDNVVIVDIGSSVYKFDLLSGMVDLSNYVQKSSTSGLIKNDGSIDTNAYAKKSEMSVTPGTGTDADKTIIQLKSGTSATVLKTHQDISGKVDKEIGKGLSTNDYTTEEKTKLAGISEGANKVESSETNGNIKINGVETQVYDDSELQDIVSTDENTVEGNPINFSTLSAQNAVSTIIDLEPIQDLHGYDKPWVGGAGKNLFVIDEAIIKSIQPTYDLSTHTYTSYGITYEVLFDEDGNAVGIHATGTPTTTSIFTCGTLTLPKDISYTVIAGVNTNNDENLVRISGPDDLYTYNYNSKYETTGQTFSIPEDGVLLRSGLRVKEGQNIDLTFRPGLYLATETDKSFIPYTNICPISGRTEVNIEGDNGKESTDSDYVVSNDLTISLGQTVYGGTLDVENGVLVVDRVKTSTNDITLISSISTSDNVTMFFAYPFPKIDFDRKEEIISDRLEFLGTTASVSRNLIGIAISSSYLTSLRLQMPASLVGTTESSIRTYLQSENFTICTPLAEPITIQLTPNEISLLEGVNNISTTGDKITLTYRDGKVATLGDLTSAMDSLDNKIDESKILTDTATGDKYILVITNGVLDIQQVSN